MPASSRKAVGWAFENTLDASLAIVALENALQARKPTPGSLIHHSDRGVQYASIAYRRRLAERDITISMSRPAVIFTTAQGAPTSAVIPGRALARARNPFGLGDCGEMDSGLATSSRPGMTGGEGWAAVAAS